MREEQLLDQIDSLQQKLTARPVRTTMATVTRHADVLAHTIRAVIGAAAFHDFDVFWPYSPAERAIVFERAVSHGRGQPRTYDKLRVRLNPEAGSVEYARLVVDGVEHLADVDGDCHPFDVIDAFLLDR